MFASSAVSLRLMTLHVCNQCLRHLLCPSDVMTLHVCNQCLSHQPCPTDVMTLHVCNQCLRHLQYLLCPSDVTMGHLKKFLRIKFALSEKYQVGQLFTFSPPSSIKKYTELFSVVYRVQMSIAKGIEWVNVGTWEVEPVSISVFDQR